VNVRDQRENILFALRCIEEVAAERRNARVLFACGEIRQVLKNTMQSLEGENGLAGVRLQAQRVASDMLAAVKFEMREVLIPFSEVKQPTREFGLQTFSDYFQWLSPEKAYTPEALVGILEEQMRKLEIALEHISKP